MNTPCAAITQPLTIKKSVKSIGQAVWFNGEEIGLICGSRDPSGKRHQGYWLELANGKTYGFRESAKRPGAYAYADDLKREIKGWIGVEIVAQLAQAN